MHIKDIITDANGNKLSINKLWYNIGCFVYTVAFARDAWIHELTAEKSFAYGAIVVGSGAAFKMIGNKHGMDTSMEENTDYSPPKRKPRVR